MMKICLTGGAGFIGSWVAQAYLDAGHDVIIIDDLSTGKASNIPEKATFLHGDITTMNLEWLFEQEQFDVLNHHAANMELRKSVEDPLHDAKINIFGTLRLLEAAAKAKVGHVILASSGGAIYGEQQYYPADELHPTRPISPYGIAKRTGEMYLDYYHDVHGMKTTALRYSNVYGPRQNPFGEAGVIAIFIEKMLHNREYVINGDGSHTRDYVHVSDVAQANLLVTESGIEGVYNVSTGLETSVNDIVSLLGASIESHSIRINGPEKPGDLKRNVCSPEALRKHGWDWSIDLQHGIKETVDWFKFR